MKIVVLYDFLSELGGIERVIALESHWLQKIRPTLAFLSVDEKMKREFIEQYSISKDIPITTVFNFFKNEALAIMLSFLIPFSRKIKADLILSHGFFSSFLSYKLKKFCGQRYHIFIHHPPNFLYLQYTKEKKVFANSLKRKIAIFMGSFFRPYLRFLDKIIVKNAETLFVNSKYTQERVRSIYNRESVICYPPYSSDFAVKTPTWAHSHLEKFKIPKKFILTHGRLVPDKRVDYIIRALVHLSDHLVISGTIPEKTKTEIERLVAELGLNDRVTVLGRVSKEELIALYNTAEVFVLTAPKEDFGLVPIEAMACGTPCVAWGDRAGPSETVVNGKNGYLARPYDLYDLALKVTQAKTLKKQRENISDSVLAFSEERAKKVFLKSFLKE